MDPVSLLTVGDHTEGTLGAGYRGGRGVGPRGVGASLVFRGTRFSDTAVFTAGVAAGLEAGVVGTS